jgi:aminoglycoside/choline kinase family phosphotransferase
MSPITTPATLPSSSVPLWADSQRKTRFDTWFGGLISPFQLIAPSLRPASTDASFRRYLRVDTAAPSGAKSLIIMDAPPELEGSTMFVQLAQLMQKAGLTVPEILAWDEPNGFLLLTDLGPQTLLQAIDPNQAPPLNLYLDAIETLVQWQKASQEGVLPAYDRALLLGEMELFPQWYVAVHRKIQLNGAQRKTMDDAFARIVENNLSWPSVYVHRDFMPRNLMVNDASAVPGNGASASRLGVLDFQDAVFGPITYDIACLMRDAFLSWDEDFCLDVTIRYWEKARKAGLPVGSDFGEFYRGVEWMGLQRHLKVAGIFARLTLRDGKPQYLADTPRFIAYMRATCARYMELKPLLRLIESIEGIALPNAFAFGRI